MNEHAVMAIIKGFQEEHLKNQTLMGFAVLDEDQGILIASSFDQNYGEKLTNPIRTWVVYQTPTGCRAFELKSDDDFKRFSQAKYLAAAA